VTFQVKKSRSGFRIEIEWIHEEDEIYIPEEVIRQLHSKQGFDWEMALIKAMDVIGTLLGGKAPELPEPEERPKVVRRKR
jgi:hypothetical protein